MRHTCDECNYIWVYVYVCVHFDYRQPPFVGAKHDNGGNMTITILGGIVNGARRVFLISVGRRGAAAEIPLYTLLLPFAQIIVNLAKLLLAAFIEIQNASVDGNNMAIPATPLSRCCCIVTIAFCERHYISLPEYVTPAQFKSMDTPPAAEFLGYPDRRKRRICVQIYIIYINAWINYALLVAISRGIFSSSRLCVEL